MVPLCQYKRVTNTDRPHQLIITSLRGHVVDEIKTIPQNLNDAELKNRLYNRL